MREATLSPETNVSPATIHNAPRKPSRSAVTPAITGHVGLRFSYDQSLWHFSPLLVRDRNHHGSVHGHVRDQHPFTSREEIFSPPLTMMSFFRSTIST